MAKQLAAVVLLLATYAVAQDGLTIKTKAKPLITADAQKIYLTGCAAVRREFGAGEGHCPPMSLILDAGTDGAYLQSREIRLRKWNPYLFAQGVVVLAFDELLTDERKMEMAKRAVSWAEATVAATRLGKQSKRGMEH